MSIYTGPSYGEIESVEFAVAGDADNAREAVVEVKNYELFSDQKPVSGGCFDARMGTTSHDYNCATCQNQRRDDPGHAGFLRARAPLVSPLFITEARRWLRVVCLACGAPVVDPARVRKHPRAQRLAKAAATVKEGVVCPACGAAHPKIVKTEDDYFSFLKVDTKTGAQEPLGTFEMEAVFGRVTAATTRAFGRPAASHPSRLVVRNVPLAPNSIRPGVRLGYSTSGVASSHCLTTLIQYLVGANLNLPEGLTAAQAAPYADAIESLQQVYFSMIVGSDKAVPTQGETGKRGIVLGSAAVSSIVRNFAKKEGRLRKNLLGKRVWNISRSTISGYQQLRIDEVGYPVAFARTVQICEEVQEYNLERLMRFFQNGRREYPGCSRVVKKATGATYRVEGVHRDFRLEIGDRLYRDVVTGDAVYFNRQPTLERSSIGVHRAVVMRDPGIHTFRMNVIACDWYNADFDGDEMNLWVPHDVMTRAEAQIMSRVSNWFISSKTGGPVNGQVQDSVVGSFELSRAAVAVAKYPAMALFAGARVPYPDFGGAPRALSGRELVSRLFEQAPVNYSRPPNWYKGAFASFVDYDPGEVRTTVVRGRLVEGVLDKASVGAGAAGGLFHLIASEYGAQKALDMIFALQQISIAFIERQGFTVGTGDMIVDAAATGEIRRIVGGLLEESRQITARLVRGELIPPIGMTTHEYYERLQLAALVVPDEILRPVVGSLDPNWNGLFKMIATGSKGSTPNLMHISGLIGQVTINARRIGEQFGVRRTNVFFPRFATSPEAYGFIKNNFINGLTSAEFVYSSMNGRFDLINKALSTASTGYRNRKAIMSLQTAITDNFRRAAKGRAVVQLLYGDDGLAADRVERVRLRSALLDDAELAAAFRLRAGGAAEQAVFDAAFAEVKADRDWFRAALLPFEDTDFNTALGDTAQLPVDVRRLVRNVLAEGPKGAAPAPAEVAAMAGRVREFCALIPYVLLNEVQERRRAAVPAHVRAATRLFQAHVRAELAPPTLARLSPARLAVVLDAARLHYARALVDYGVAVGILAAQAVSEPLTQYMLDSHHRSVAGGTNKSGLVRPEEIFTAKPVEAEASSEMLLRVRPEIEGSRAAVLQVASQIEMMELKRFVARWAVLFESLAGGPQFPAYRGDAAWMGSHAKGVALLAPPSDLASWCLRLELDKSMMILKSVELETIVERVRAGHPQAYVVHTAENVAQVVVRVYFREAQFRGAAEEKVVAFLGGPFLDTSIRGVPGITAAEVAELKRTFVGEGGALERRTVYAVKTTGTNIYGVLLNKNIDPLRVVSSSIGDTAKLFGIAAARGTIVREIRRFIGGRAPAVRHMQLYADEMTRTGRVTPLEQKGVVAREKHNVLLHMAMASPAGILQNAALTNAREKIHGIAPYLMVGRTPRVGTLWNDVIIDQDYVRATTESVDDILSGLDV